MKPHQFISCLCVVIGVKMILETSLAAVWSIWSSVWAVTMQPVPGQAMWMPLISLVMTTFPGVLGVVLVWFAPWLGGFLVRFAGVPEHVEWSMAMDSGQFLRAILVAMGIFFMATALPGILTGVIHAMSATLAPWATPRPLVTMNHEGALGIVGSAVRFGAGYGLLRSAKRISLFIFRRA